MDAHAILPIVLSLLLLSVSARPLGAEEDGGFDGRTVLDSDSPVSFDLKPLFDPSRVKDLDHMLTEEEDPRGWTRPDARLESLDLESELVAASRDPGSGLVGAAAETLLHTQISPAPLGALLTEVGGEEALHSLLDEARGEPGLRQTLGEPFIALEVVERSVSQP
jgi:hypothetical protein